MQKGAGKNSKKKLKRGLSTIVVTLIVILVSLVAVGIIWVVVKNVIQTGSEGVGLGQFSLSAKIIGVSIDNSSNNVSFTVRRNAGKGDLIGINFVFSSGTDTEVITQKVSLNELEERKFNLHLSNISVSDLISVSIVPLIKQNEEETLGIILDKYNLKGSSGTSSGGTSCTPTNCTTLGYLCGNWNDGCGRNLDCGNCTGGQVCNSSGRCVTSCTPLINNYCSVQEYECGYWGNNTCSGNLSCGTCLGGQVCNSSGKCVSSCTPTNCTTLGYECGSWSDGCGGTLNCNNPGCGSRANCSFGTCVCNSGWGDCNNDNTCECDLSLNICSAGSCVPAGEIALSCSRTDVQTAVNNANRGDIIIVPAGTCTWSSSLVVSKGITLKGAGIDQTTIKGKIILISYDPDSMARTNHETFKIEGFTFDGNGATSADLSWMGLIGLHDTSSEYINVIIKNNKFKNTTATGIYISGTIYGVASSNQFDMMSMPIRSFGNDEYSWAAFSNTRTYGSSDNFYFENNNLSFSSPFSGSPGWIESGQGGRIVVRYNFWNDANTSGDEYWDIHGLQTPNSTGGNCQQYSTMIAEYYGNLRINTQDAYRAMYLRGGWLMQFNNVISGLGSPPHTFGEYSCDECAAFGIYPQHINNTYFWNNLDDGIIKGLQKQFDDCTTYTITENRDYFNYNSSCTSTSCPVGIGCGATAPTGTCNTGVGYWVTDYSPCYSAPSTMAEMKTITQAGKFYKCTAPNTWTLYYQPYTYPHPLTLI